MEKETRKASEILLELESKIDIILNFIRTHDLNMKILSNKINMLMEKDKRIESIQPLKVEAIDHTLSQNEIITPQDLSLSIEDKPKGFRRTSRPETYSGDNSYLRREPSNPQTAQKFPDVEIKVPKENVVQFTEVPAPAMNKNINSQSNVSVIQRIVDKNGKSIFLADVEILEFESKNSFFKTRTNGTGKWMASLPIGKYRILINKRESLSKQKLEVTQDINIDGSSSKLELQTVIIRSKE